MIVLFKNSFCLLAFMLAHVYVQGLVSYGEIIDKNNQLSFKIFISFTFQEIGFALIKAKKGR